MTDTSIRFVAITLGGLLLSWPMTFIDDYEFTAAGDLDECNGMTRSGSYGYYVTEAYPWVIGCFRGTPDTSFRKGR